MRETKTLFAALLAFNVVFALSFVDGSSQFEQRFIPDIRFDDNPVRSGEEDEIKNLPGLEEPINFRQFSGYLEADEKGKSFNHYWLVESQSDPENDPLVLWLNGGPGCSSLGGLFTELGPFKVNDDSKTLKLNEFSWNKVANVIFLESPSAVGFSYTTDYTYYDDDRAAKENYYSLKSFMKKFPQYKQRPLYITGESYAGVYLPTLGVLLEPETEELNFKGVAIGNGYLDAGKLSNSLAFFSYHYGFMDKREWQVISKYCCNGNPPSREDCFTHSAASDPSCQEALMQADSIDLVPNVYNIYSNCSTLVTSEQEQVGHQDSAVVKREISRDKLGRVLSRFNLLNLNRNRSDTVVDLASMIRDFDRKKLNQFKPTCANGLALKNYLNSAKVREAIHVAKAQQWSDCIEFDYAMLYPDKEGGLSPQIRQLVESKRNLTMLIYNGDVDSVCNFLGDEWFAEDLGLAVRQELKFWRVDRQVAGSVKHYAGLTFATVRGSGHMVPEDKPREALEMFKTFLKSSSSASSASDEEAWKGNVRLEEIQ